MLVTKPPGWRRLRCPGVRVPGTKGDPCAPVHLSCARGEPPNVTCPGAPVSSPGLGPQGLTAVARGPWVLSQGQAVSGQLGACPGDSDADGVPGGSRETQPC